MVEISRAIIFGHLMAEGVTLSSAVIYTPPTSWLLVVMCMAAPQCPNGTVCVRWKAQILRQHDCIPRKSPRARRLTTGNTSCTQSGAIRVSIYVTQLQ